MRTLIREAFGSPFLGRGAVRAAILVGLVGLFAASLIAWRTDRVRQQKLIELCELRGQAFVADVSERMQKYEYGIRGLRGTVIGAGLDRLNHKTIADYMRSRDLGREFPGARGFGFIRRVPQQDLPAYLRKVGRDHPDGSFQLRELGPNIGERWIIEYVEPEAINAQAIGLDIASEIRRREAASEAMASGEPRLTAPLTLVQASDRPQRGFLLLIPIFADGLPTGTEAERVAATRGWGYAPLLIDQVLEGLDIGVDGIDVSLTDDRAGVENPLFFTNAVAPTASDLPHRQYQLSLYGRRWTVDVRARPELIAETGSMSGGWVLLIGNVLALLLALLTFFWRLPADRRLQRQADEFALSSGVIDSSPQAIVVVDEQGLIVQVNRKVLDIFGHEPEGLLGTAVENLLPTARRQAHRTLRGGFDQTRREMGARQALSALHADGHEFPVAVNLSPLSLAGRRLVVAAVEDVTERQQAVARLKESESRWRQLADSMPQLVWTCQADGPCDFLSAQWVAYTGIPEAEQLGSAWLQQVHPDDQQRLAVAWQAAVDQHGSFAVEFRIRRYDGVYRWFDTRAEPVLDGQGRVSRWIGSNTDIEERMVATSLLKESESRWRQLADSMPQMVWTCDSEGNCGFLSAQWVAYTGIPETEQLGYRWLEQLHPDDRELAERSWRQAVADSTRYNVEYRVRRHDGVYRWFDTRGVPLRDEEGGVLRWIGSNTDIEDRKRAEDELRLLNGRLEQLVDERARHIAELSERLSIATRSAGMGVWDWNINTNELIWDEQMYRLYFFDPKAQTGREPYSVWRDHVHPEDAERTEALLMAAVAGEKDYITEFRVVGPSEQVRYVSAAALVIRDDQGLAIRMVGVNRDTTELHLAQQDLVEARVQAEQASQAKSSFLANMSHEIRTPMNAVMNLCYLLEQTRLNDEQRELTSKMRIASRSLLGLINDVLDLSKIEAGQMDLAHEVFSLRGLVDDLVKVMQVQASAKRLDLRVRLPQDLPAYFRGDSLRLTQVLTNLLSNAIKFTDRGHVGLSVAASAGVTGLARLRFEVEDTGIGISPEVQPQLFTAFAQGDESTTRRFGGTGLGLAIVKRLVSLMGGSLGLDSKPGAGSRFWFELPLPVEHEGTLAADAPQSLDTLVVDDNPAQRESVRDSCRALGWRVESVASGREAVERVSDRLKSGRPFDAMIVDWLMPEMDGLQTIERLSRLHGPSSPAAILLVTASDHQSLRRMPGAELADAVLGLPTDASTLFNAVHQAVARNSGSVGRVAGSMMRTTRSMGQRLPGVRVLLVDDSSVNLDVGKRILEREGATVLLAIHGAQALDLAREDGDALDIVLMDVQMPVMDGIESCRRIRAERGRRLPIIAVTAGALVAERQRAIEAGMNDFVSKPFDAESLIQRVRQHVEHARGELLPIGPAATTGSAILAPTVKGLALEAALARIGGDQRLLKSLLRRLLEEFADFGAKPAPAASDAERRAFAQRAHKLRGIAGNVGAERLQQLAGDLEACARDPQCQQLPTLLGSLVVALDDLRVASADWLSVDDEAGPTAEVFDEQGLAAAVSSLCQQLRQNNLTALDSVEPLAVHLQQQLGEPAYARFRAAMDGLRFAEALSLLKERAVAE